MWRVITATSSRKEKFGKTYKAYLRKRLRKSKHLISSFLYQACVNLSFSDIKRLQWRTQGGKWGPQDFSKNVSKRTFPHICQSLKSVVQNIFRGSAPISNATNRVVDTPFTFRRYEITVKFINRGLQAKWIASQWRSWQVSYHCKEICKVLHSIVDNWVRMVLLHGTVLLRIYLILRGTRKQRHYNSLAIDALHIKGNVLVKGRFVLCHKNKNFLIRRN